jgi:alpha-1,3-rhamnosyl/mannosyltransferase
VHIYDTSFLQFPQFTEERNLRFLKARIRDTAARADAVFTVSRTSAGEIHRLLNVPTDRIFCVYPGIDAAFRRPPEHDIAAFRRKNGLDRPYLLTVGTIEPRKNLEFLVDVFDRLNRFDGDLVLAGGLGWKYEPILERISKSPRAARIRRFGHIPDGDLPALYAGAELFVLPSLYEGFGLPPVEAMACGVPVVASSGGALPEILGASARIVGSFSVDDWTQAIDSLLADTSARGKLSEGGPRHASGFSWSATAAQTAEVYRKVLR